MTVWNERGRGGALLAIVLVAASCAIESGVAIRGAAPTPHVPTPSAAPTTMPITEPDTPSPPAAAVDAAAEGSGAVMRRLMCVAMLGLAACAGGDGEPSATAPTEPSVCGVSALLVPDCGAWFGVSSPSSDGTYDYTVGLAEYASVVAEPPDILRFYERGAERFPDAEHRALAEPPGRPRSILHFSWKPAPALTWREIADGGADANIDLIASSLAAYPHRMFFTVHHEPENDVIDTPGSGMTTQDYVDMYRHVVEGLRGRGVDNLVYVMSYIGFERWVDVVDELYPGDDVVDWIAWDPYAVDEIGSFSDLVNSPSGDWPGFYDWAIGKAPGTPLMLAEWGFNLPRQPWASDVLTDAPEQLSERFPAIKALVYWNDRGERFDSRLRAAEADRSDYADAFAALAADPFFNRVGTDEAP